MNSFCQGWKVGFPQFLAAAVFAVSGPAQASRSSSFISSQGHNCWSLVVRDPKSSSSDQRLQFLFPDSVLQPQCFIHTSTVSLVHLLGSPFRLFSYLIAVATVVSVTATALSMMVHSPPFFFFLNVCIWANVWRPEFDFKWLLLFSCLIC